VNQIEIVLREFVADVRSVGRKYVADEWPDLLVTYDKARVALTNPAFLVLELDENAVIHAYMTATLADANRKFVSLVDAEIAEATDDDKATWSKYSTAEKREEALKYGFYALKGWAVQRVEVEA